MHEMRAQIDNRFELSWSGETAAFRAKLAEAGIEFADPDDPGQTKIMVTVPAGFAPSTFFELARASGAVLTELKADEENLERLFFRVTGQESPVPVA
jgi:hypothetical protein